MGVFYKELIGTVEGKAYNFFRYGYKSKGRLFNINLLPNEDVIYVIDGVVVDGANCIFKNIARHFKITQKVVPK